MAEMETCYVLPSLAALAWICLTSGATLKRCTKAVHTGGFSYTPLVDLKRRRAGAEARLGGSDKHFA